MVNKVFEQGRLTADPEVSMTRNGKKVANFSIAVERPFKGQDGNRKTDFLKCEAWGKNAETVGRFFKKGSMILVVGAVYQDSYTDNNGNRREKVWINVDEVHFCESKKSEQNNANSCPAFQKLEFEGEGAGGAPYPSPADQFEDLPDDDGPLPF